MISQGTALPSDFDADYIIAGIREQCEDRDVAAIDFLLSGYVSDNLDNAFYRKALSHRNSFIRSFFSFDLDMRNAKVAYLNKALGREPGTDVMILDGRKKAEFFERDEADAVLESGDILERERGLDNMMWKKVDEITAFDIFNINIILAFIAKLKIIDRWNKLDPETGKAMFRKLVEEIRNNRDQ